MYTGWLKIRGTTQWGNIKSCWKIMRKIINKYRSRCFGIMGGHDLFF
jgi:hypothetical protein